MELKTKRLRRRWIPLTTLFILANISTASPSENKPVLHLDCFTDCERISCRFQPQEQSCSHYNLTLSNSAHQGHEKEDCVLRQCDTGMCCCTVEIEKIVIGEEYKTTVRKRGKIIEVKVSDLTSILKPKSPTITSVNESNGNFEIRWRTNMENCPIDEYSAEVTFWKKGGERQGRKKHFLKLHKAEENRAYYQIPARALEPSTTYVVCLRSFKDPNGTFSESSEEWEFTTAANRHSLIIVAVISLSIVAVIITTAAFGCYGKLKAKWKKSVALSPRPVMLEMRLGDQELLKPTEVNVCLVTIDPVVQKDGQTSLEMSPGIPRGAGQPQSSGLAAGSFSFSSLDIEAEIQRALWEKLGHLLPASSVPTTQPTGPDADTRFPFDVSTKNIHKISSPEFICFDNLTYSPCVGSEQSSRQTTDSAYHCNESNTCEQHAPTCLLTTEQEVHLPNVASSFVTTDLSYQMSSVDSGRFAHAQHSSLPSISCDTNTSTSCDLVSSVEAACESSGAGVMKVYDQNEDGCLCNREPCFDQKPVGPLSFPTVDDDYQPFRNLVGQPSVLFSEEKSGEHKEHLEKWQEEISKDLLGSAVPGFIYHSQSQSPSELQKPCDSSSSVQSAPVIRQRLSV